MCAGPGRRTLGGTLDTLPRVQAIWLDDGCRVDLGEPTSGGSKNDTRLGQIGSQRVVVKIERAHGRLIEEAQALRYLAAHRIRVPRVLASGVTPDGDQFLVLSHEPGVRPISADGWERFGRDLAALLEVPTDGCTFPRVTTTEFVEDHRERLNLVRALLTQELADQISRAILRIAGVERLVVTHGDPGSGNYLDDETNQGVLLDWETATVSPCGLDLGRAVFIGLMDLGRTGIPEQLVTALTRGYLDHVSRMVALAPELLPAWTTIAGLQFIHGRHTQPLRPDRTPEIAARVLATYLARV